ncbi:AAA family ATPase [Lysinibacillus boronitolerans]|uniref:ATP-binding protein n=2 Tax=Lysinibacillus TaxID=400634 RepID=UPI00037F3759
MMTIQLKNGTVAHLANYQADADLIEFRNNPLIEALPPIYSHEQLVELLMLYPPFHESERLLDEYKRVHCIQRLLQYFQPIPLHLETYSSIDRVLRTGYLSRNPLSQDYALSFYNTRNSKMKSFDNVANQTGQTISIIGTSGVGKTRTLQRILNLYPQVISHVEYNQQPLNMYQITYLFIQTPFDGSVKTLIYDFFYQFDQLMGTKYFDRYANSRLSTSQLMPIVASLSKHIGVLIIDEIQHLKSMKLKSSTEVLNFMTTLINQVNIPIVMVGTPKAMEVLQLQFRQARRSFNPGNIMWDRLQKDEIWDLLIAGLFKYQWTRFETPLTPELSSLFYEHTQGICDILIKLFMMVQLRAISSGEEKITPELIDKVANEELKMVQPMLKALKEGNVKRLVEYDDLFMPNIENFMQREKVQLDKKQVMRSLKDGADKHQKQEQLVNEAVVRLQVLGIDEADAKLLITNVLKEEPITDVAILVKKAYLASTNFVSRSAVETIDLREIVKQGKQAEQTAYEALLESGLIRREYMECDAS